MIVGAPRSNAMHTDSSMTVRFHIVDHWLGVGDGERSANYASGDTMIWSPSGGAAYQPGASEAPPRVRNPK